MLYLFVAVVTTSLRNKQELYPFFNWSLFSAAGNPKYDTVILVRSLDGVPLKEPRYFFEMKERFAAARTGDLRLGKALDRLRIAAMKGDVANEAQIRTTVESLYLGEARQIEYDLVMIGYDPIERLNNGTIQRTQFVKAYRK